MKTKMKIKGNILVSVMLIILLVVLMIPSIRFIRDNDISHANRLKRKAEKEYLSKDYVSAYSSYKRLIDSLNNEEDAVGINYANAAFLSADLLKRGLGGTGVDQTGGSDSSLQRIAVAAREKYGALTGSPESTIASVASNQLGYAGLKSTDVFAEANPDSVLVVALEHFKNALRKDPSNDSARYNYELIKLVVNFPETILSETKALIAQKRYRQAATVLSEGMRRDPRLRQQQEFMNRLRTVIAIDSLEGRGS